MTSALLSPALRPDGPPAPAVQLWTSLPLPLWVLTPGRVLLFQNRAAAGLAQAGQAALSAGHLMRLGSLSATTLESLLHLSRPEAAQRAALWLTPQHTGWLEVQALPAALGLASGWPEPARLICLHLDRPELAQQARVDALCAQMRFSPAERCVLLLLADGLTPEAVARQLGIQLSTTRVHVRKLLLKSRAPSMTQLLRWVGSADALPG